MPPRARILARFAALSFLCIAAMGLTMGYVLSTLLTDAVSRWEWENTAALTRSQVERADLAGLFQAPQDEAARERWRREVPRLFADVPEVVRLKVWGPDGTILWSDNEELIGQRFPDNRDFQVSRAGQIAVALKEPRKGEHAQDRRQFAVLAEVYVPIFAREGGEILGVIEVYKTPVRLLQTIRRGRLIIWTVSAASGLALYLALLPLVRHAYGRRVYEAALRQHADRLEDQVAARTRQLEEETSERKRVEEQLRQAQKMEAIGRLAGGIAHDFNNLLAVMLCHGELLLQSLAPQGPAHGHATQIVKTAGRAADLTRQLLAFSRKQILAPRVVDLNGIVRGMESMLGRLIGEDVRLRLVLAPALRLVRADPAQLEQVILNLAVNARDAMPRGGQLTLETGTVELDEGYARRHPGARPGPHVMLAVSDTGVGMDAETRARVFEPFFTTKGPGRGTGLGLATVYGIVKQSGGNIWVYSEPGHGSTFKIYLPCAEADAVPLPDRTLAAPARGTETILLVEDEGDMREVTRQVLELYGYALLVAGDPEEALRLAESHAGPVHLLLTDVVMPGMSGRELADRLRLGRPGMQVLYVSGYTDDAVVRHGALAPGTAFLQKPFTPEALARHIRQVLDAAAREVVGT